MTRRTAIAAIGGIALVLAVVATSLLLLRPSSAATVGDGVTVECDGIGSDEACAAWAAVIMSDGPGIHTFDPEDLAHLSLTRPFLLPGECEVAYFVGRTLEEPVAHEVVACPEG